MTEIPDDVVERAIADAEAILGQHIYMNNKRRAFRAALRVSMEWERDRLKASIDLRMNNYLCDMKPEYDDSITGFNEAWDVVRAAIRSRTNPDDCNPSDYT